MDVYTQVYDLCMVLAGVYMLYSAIIGRGSIYKNENIKSGLAEKYKKAMRLFCLLGGLTAAATGLLDYLQIQPFAMIMFGALTLMMIFFIVIIIRYTVPQNERHHK
jgi:hypothetical protein